MSSLQTKNMVAGVGCIISSSVVPSTGDLAILSDAIFYSGTTLLILSVVGSGFLASKQVNDDLRNDSNNKIKLPMFKFGIALVLLSLLLNAFMLPESYIVLLTVLIANLSLIASVFFEKYVPDIFTENDIVRAKK